MDFNFKRGSVFSHPHATAPVPFCERRQFMNTVPACTSERSVLLLNLRCETQGNAAVQS